MPCSRSTKYAGNKDWFGDWEKSARIEKLRNSEPVVISGTEIESSEDLKQYKKNAFEYGKRLQGSYVNQDTGKTISLQRGRKRGGVNEVLQHDYKDAEHLQSIAAIPSIIEQAIYIDSATNEDNKVDADSFDYYVAGVQIAGVDYTVRAVVVNTKNGETYYDHKLSSIEKGNLLDLMTSQGDNHRDFGTTPDPKSTITDISDVKDTKLVSLLRNDASKVVDENGEPLVVYHGTGAKFNAFSSKKTATPMFYFTSERHKIEEGRVGARSAGRIMEVYLNMRNPASWREEDRLTTDQIKHKGYDGKALLDDGYNVYVAFSPTQIKSATDNVGSFDVENPDIRFRIGERRKADMKAGLLNKLTNATDEQVERTINEIEKLGESFKEGGNPKLEKVAFHWAKKGTIILPEDNDKIIQAVRLAENAKVDPMKYDRPMEIINKYNTDVEYGNPINPDDIPAFTNKREIGKSGVFVYDVEESDAGQKAVCKVAHAQFGYSRKDEMSRQPWCLASFTRTGEPTQSAKGFWFNTYNSVGKKIAFKDGKAIAFSAHDKEVEGDLWWDLNDEPSRNLPLPNGEYLGTEGEVQKGIKGDEVFAQAANSMTQKEAVDMLVEMYQSNYLSAPELNRIRSHAKDVFEDFLWENIDEYGSDLDGYDDYEEEYREENDIDQDAKLDEDDVYEIQERFINDTVKKIKNSEYDVLTDFFDFWDKEENRKLLEYVIDDYVDSDQYEDILRDYVDYAPESKYAGIISDLEEKSYVRYRITTGDNELDNKIGKSLYRINKEAKRYRDLKSVYYQDGHTISDKSVFDAISELGLVPEGVFWGDNEEPVAYSGEKEVSLDEIPDELSYIESEISSVENSLDDEDIDSDDKKELEEDLRYWEDLLDELEEAKGKLEKLHEIDVMECFSDKINELYDLKRQTINKLIDADKGAIPDGLHKFEGGDVRRLYQLGDYSFHGEDISDEINDEELEGVSEIEEIQSDNILAKDVSLEEAIELLNRIDIEVADGTNVAFDSSTNDIRFRLQEENDKFNKELERYAKGELGSNEYISIGKPFGVLALFMPDDQIILRQKVLSKSLKKHGLNISSIRDLPKAISKPVFIFRSKRGSLSILTELTSPEGKSIFVAIGLGAKKQLGHEFLEVNDVLTIHGREEENVILPIIENNSLIWVDKEKGQRWLSSAKSNSQAIANDALSSATKIIKEFENPTSMDIRLRANREETAYDMAFGRSVKESMVKQVAKKFSVPMSTKVVSRLNLPEEQQKKSVIYDNGTLSIVAENIKDGDIELATLDEVLPKQGLSALVDSNVQEDILTVLGKASGAFMGNASQESVRSYISDLHTQSVSPDMIGAMADVMRGMLDAAGFNSKLSDPNAAYMLYKAIRGDKNGSTAAEDIVSKMQEANVRKVLSDYDEVFNKMTDEQIMDELNPEHNEDLRTRIENAQRRINAVNAMFRYESDNTGRSMAETMHQIYSKRGIEWRRKWVDETVVFDQYQKEIEKLTGKKVPDFANLHEIYNQSSSIATATIDRLEKHYYKPAIEQARKVKELLGFNDRQLHDYMIAKHAPERNAKMRQDIMEEKGISYEETGVEGSIEEEAGDEDPSGDIIIGDKVSYIDQDGNIQEGVVQSQNGAEYIGVSDEQGNITPVHVDNVRPIEEIVQEESPQGLQDVYGNEAQEEAQPQKTAVPVSVDTHSEQDVVDDILSQSQGDIEIAIEAAKFELDQSKKEVKKLSKEVPPEAKTSREAFIRHKLQQKAVIEEANERLQKMQRVIAR